jgi:pyruvate formate lyase activating enzyme
MKIGGIQKLSLIDYPQKTAAVIFTQGCNMFCPYCHNPQLVYPHLFEDVIKEGEVFDFFKKRQKVLQAIVITGGEPTIQKDLKDFIKRVKEFNYKVKLDTNGSNPQIVRELIDEKLIDFIAMDIKSPLQKYNFFYKGDIENVKSSIETVKSSKLPCQFRTTYDKSILNDDDLENIKELCFPSQHIMQECRK